MRSLLETTLEIAVPLWLERMQHYGGPDDNDWAWAREWGVVLASAGDNLLFTSKKRGETARLFNDLARAVAILMHEEGGVHLFGHWWIAP